jgi:hypothetical protein
LKVGKSKEACEKKGQGMRGQIGAVILENSIIFILSENILVSLQVLIQTSKSYSLNEAVKN